MGRFLETGNSLALAVSQPGNKSLVLLVMLYMAESWPLSAQMNQLINSFATSAYRVTTGVKRLDKVHNTTVPNISLQE